jgi:hypothetical protein
VKPGGGLLLAVVSAVVLAAVVAGFLALGSPGEERLRQLDQRRIEDLRAIADDVMGIYGAADGGVLPDSLPQIASVTTNVVRRDPVTNTAYSYRKLAADCFELCAKFDLPAEDSDPRRFDGGWGHPAGDVCFEFKATGPVRTYPVRPSAVRNR